MSVKFLRRLDPRSEDATAWGSKGLRAVCIGNVVTVDSCNGSDQPGRQKGGPPTRKLRLRSFRASRCLKIAEEFAHSCRRDDIPLALIQTNRVLGDRDRFLYVSSAS